MAGPLSSVSQLVIVMDRGLLGLMLCLVVMCVAGAIGSNIRGPAEVGEKGPELV